MTADATPIAADKTNIRKMSVPMAAMIKILEPLLFMLSSAGIGVASAVIGVPRSNSRGAR